MHFIKRDKVCELFKVAQATSYRIFGSLPGGRNLLTDTSIVDLLNESRQGGQPFVSDLPSDFLTAEDIEEQFGIPTTQLKSWCVRRKRNIPPHYRFNRHTVRFRLSTFTEWLEKTMRVRRGYAG